MKKIPRSASNDYSADMVNTRRQFIERETNTTLPHLSHFSLPPESVAGNIENFTGVAQVPIGFAGPMTVMGEAAQGDFYVPMATTEGTLTASYSRGMRLTREARAFGKWIKANFEPIKQACEASTTVGKLRDIEQYAVSKLRWLRFNFTSGDAAGQNMVSKATKAGCEWIIANYPAPIEHFVLSANLDTDKKHSHLNTLHTRGKRVVAEVTLPKELVTDVMHCTPEALFKQRQYSNMGAMMAGSVSNGAHFANGITALFIACGQDVANVAESSAGFTYAEITPNGDYYFSVTIPSLIVATYGGGTGLGTQAECLRVLGCDGTGKVNKFAEIVAATVLCGDLSLASAVVADEWVSSHERLGRNR